MKSISTFFLALMLLSASAEAQQSGYVGMHHLKPKPAPAAPTPPAEEVAEPEEDENTVPPLPTYKAMAPKDALIKIDDLERWDHMSDAALAHTDRDIQSLVHLIESDRGAVPPQGLFLAAKSLADRNLMEKAALYYFAGQLRLKFDAARWPSVQNADDLKRKAQDSRKSADQVAPNQNTTPRIDNPHAGVESLGNQIGAPIISWVLKDPERMNKMIKQVKEWDISSPYEYLPDYDLTEPVAFTKWDKLLVKTREDYFKQMIDWSKMMAKVRR